MILALLAACAEPADDTSPVALASTGETATPAPTGVVWHTVAVPCVEDAEHRFIGQWMPPDGLLAVYAMAYRAETNTYQTASTSDSGYLPGKMAALYCAFYESGTGSLVSGDAVTVTWAVVE